MLPLLLLLLLLLLLYRNTETGEQKRKNGDRMTEERGGDGRRREITHDLGQHTARPACQSSFSYSRIYSYILSFLSYSNAQFLFPPPPPAVIGVPNCSAIVTSVMILEQGAVLSNPGGLADFDRQTSARATHYA